MKYILETKKISKYFESSNVQANNEVDIKLSKGEIHAVIGENGAGKTTLMNILYGLVSPDSGEIFIEGVEKEINHPNEAINLGIGMVHQHFKLVPSYSVAENITLGMEPRKNKFFLDKKEESKSVKELSNKMGLEIDPDSLIKNLSVGMQQRVEILKVLHRNAEILIFDEPTAVLTPQEVRELLKVVKSLAKKGKTILFITHKLGEVMEVADTVTVMRQGSVVGTKKVKDTNVNELASMMVGRDINFVRIGNPNKPGEVVLSVEDLMVLNEVGVEAVKGVSFEVRRNQIVGIAGVSGNGQNELVEAIVGMKNIEYGNLTFYGDNINKLNVGKRRDLGIAHIPEDRIGTGLNMGANLEDNIVLTGYKTDQFSKFGFLLKKEMQKFSKDIIERFSVASAVPGEGVSMLSGGNMQKVVLGRELSGNPKLVIANQPTRGLDVGSIEFVHKTLINNRDNGSAIILISVELEEIFNLSDVVVVMFDGLISGIVKPEEVTLEEIGLLMAGQPIDEDKLIQYKEMGV